MKAVRLLVLMLMMSGAPLVSADIIAWDLDDDGDGAVDMDWATWEESTYELSEQCTQYWWPGHLLGSFTTDTEEDPTVWIRNTVINEGDVAPLVWTDFHINIYMNKTFTILDAVVPEPSDWQVYEVTQPTLQAGQWVGSVDYLGGTPISYGDEGQFDVKVSFLGSINYCLELIPTPEPTSLLLCGLGGLVLIRRR